MQLNYLSFQVLLINGKPISDNGEEIKDEQKQSQKKKRGNF